jgi:hypothetical protein
MCGGGGGYRPPPAVVQKPVQAAVAPAAGARKKTTKQVPKVGTVTQANLLGGTAGIIDDNLNLGGKSILGG